jgi:hypothetical protein
MARKNPYTLGPKESNVPGDDLPHSGDSPSVSEAKAGILRGAGSNTIRGSSSLKLGTTIVVEKIQEWVP